MQDQPIVFLSYARKNSKQIDIIEDILLEVGYQPWVDRQKLIGGNDWSREIQSALDRCDFYVLLLTPEALQSAAVQQEYTYALAQRKHILIITNRIVVGVPPELQNMPTICYDKNRDRFTYTLVDAIDRFGMPLPRIERDFLRYTALARYFGHRLPGNWSAFTVPQSTYVRILIFDSILFILVTLFASGLIYMHHDLLWIIVIGGTLYFNFGVTRIIRIWSLASGNDLPDVVVITPEGFLIHRVFSIGYIHFRVIPYQFAAIREISQKHLLFGMNTLAIKPLFSGLKQQNVTTLNRWSKRPLIWNQILTKFQQYQQHAIEIPNRESILEQRIDSPIIKQQDQVPARTHTIFIYATPQDQAFINYIQPILERRQHHVILSWQVEHDQLAFQNAINNSSAILLVISSNTFPYHGVYHYAEIAKAQQKFILPLIADHHRETPAWLSTLQWIDCSHSDQWDYHRADIIIALANAGIALPANRFDSELALAQGVRLQLPPDSKRYVAQNGYYTTKLADQRFFAILLIMGAVIVSIIAIKSNVLPLLGQNITYIIEIPIIGIIVTLFVMYRLNWTSSYAKLIRRIINHTAFPEMFVITPKGFAAYTIQKSSSTATKISIISYAFWQIEELTPFPPSFGKATSLLIREKNTQKVNMVPILKYNKDLTPNCIAAFNEYHKQSDRQPISVK